MSTSLINLPNKTSTSTLSSTIYIPQNAMKKQNKNKSFDNKSNNVNTDINSNTNTLLDSLVNITVKKRIKKNWFFYIFFRIKLSYAYWELIRIFLWWKIIKIHNNILKAKEKQRNQIGSLKRFIATKLRKRIKSTDW